MGGARTLRFTTAPTQRWPDTVATFDPQSGILFTSKLFSAHVATKTTGADEDATDFGLGFDEFGGDWRYFFDCMLAPMARPAARALTTLAPYIGDDPNLADGSEKPKSVAPGLTKLLLKFAEPFAGDKVYVPKPAKMTAIAPPARSRGEEREERARARVPAVGGRSGAIRG